MRPTIILHTVWYWIAGLVIRSVKALCLGAMAILAAILLFILAAQLTRYARLGDWHPVPNSELLELLKITVPPIEASGLGTLIQGALALPATLSLLFGIIVLFLIKRLMNALDRKRRLRDPHIVRRQAMLKDIEDAMAGPQG